MIDKYILFCSQKITLFEFIFIIILNIEVTYKMFFTKNNGDKNKSIF